jgi:hypothetical protein
MHSEARIGVLAGDRSWHIMGGSGDPRDRVVATLLSPRSDASWLVFVGQTLGLPRPVWTFSDGQRAADPRVGAL